MQIILNSVGLASAGPFIGCWGAVSSYEWLGLEQNFFG